MEFTYKPQGVCSRSIHIVLEDDVIRSVRFEGGCNGNAQGIAALVKGRNAHEVIEQLRGIQCEWKPTSCPDQLSRALEQALEQQHT